MHKNTPAHIPTITPPPASHHHHTFGHRSYEQIPSKHNDHFSGSSARSRREELSPATDSTKSTNSYRNKEVIVTNNNERRITTDTHSGQQMTTVQSKTASLTTSASRSTSWWEWLLSSKTTSSSSSSSSSTSSLAHLRPSTAACVTILLLSTTCSLCSASLCDSQSWWNPYKDKCIPCTVCQGDRIPLIPCQVHRDTVCGSIYDLKIDWVVLSKTEPNWKERRKFDGLDYGLDHHQLTAEQLQDEADPLDWQTAALFLAVLACLLFFIVAACILVHHMRQWRRMERRLDHDVEELSTKLMAKLAEVQSLEGGTFFIGNADALRIPPSSAATMTTVGTTFHQPQHVMLPEKMDKHHNQHHHFQQHHHLMQQDRRLFNTTTTTLKCGNVYIEENGNGSKC